MSYHFTTLCPTITCTCLPQQKILLRVKAIFQKVVKIRDFLRNLMPQTIFLCFQTNAVFCVKTAKNTTKSNRLKCMLCYFTKLDYGLKQFKKTELQTLFAKKTVPPQLKNRRWGNAPCAQPYPNKFQVQKTQSTACNFIKGVSRTRNFS